MSKDENLKRFFSEKELKIIKEAIEDHRASSNHDPRSIYGKIVSTADRNITVSSCLKRTYTYGKKLKPDDIVYTDCVNKECKIHISINELCEIFNEKLRKQVCTMHFDSFDAYEDAKDAGFMVATREISRDELLSKIAKR